MDTRPGALYGSVIWWEKTDTDQYPPLWASVTQMVTDTAEHLEAGRPWREYRPEVEDQVLIWSDEPLPQ